MATHLEGGLHLHCAHTPLFLVSPPPISPLFLLPFGRLASPAGTITSGCFSTSFPSSSSSASLCSTCSSGWWWRTSTSVGSTRKPRRPGDVRRNGCGVWRKSAGVRRYTCLVGRQRYNHNLSETCLLPTPISTFLLITWFPSGW